MCQYINSDLLNEIRNGNNVSFNDVENISLLYNELSHYFYSNGIKYKLYTDDYSSMFYNTGLANALHPGLAILFNFIGFFSVFFRNIFIKSELSIYISNKNKMLEIRYSN
ncbi:hypothetical protein SCC4092_0201325 [Aggregatibacter actinomycetemcomitans serotype b str. SCC4092]|nr:hypothetical protein SCC1398_0200475 [Aggregatibacter actinomycetemcomitans serotype b str. SCC1398]KOE56168.1 hypothetical protein SCC4092_0201325 [Aggregatibacter actinomycetemcomitans serotype b str. SCC4092]